MHTFLQVPRRSRSLVVALAWVMLASSTIVGSSAAGAAQGLMPLGPELTTTQTCLAGSGRIDTTLVNVGESDATYRILIDGLSPRVVNLAAGDFVRVPVTGRPAGDLGYQIFRNGVRITQQELMIDCGGESPAVSSPEVSVINACRDSNGFITAQFSNPTDESRAYIVEFDGVDNRSQTVRPYASGTRAISGRPDDNYAMRVRVGATVIFSASIRVACDFVDEPVPTNPSPPAPTPPPAETELTWTFRAECINDAGSFIFEVNNPGPDSVFAGLSVSGLAERIVQVRAGDMTQIIRSGRQPGTYDVSATINSVPVYSNSRESVCAQ